DPHPAVSAPGNSQHVRLLKQRGKRHTAAITLKKSLLSVLLMVASVSAAHRGMIAHYRFENDGLDAAAVSFTLESDALRFQDGALDLTTPTYPIYVDAPVPALTYNAISVAVDIKPSPLPADFSPILSCGPGYRWLDINVNGGFLEVALNNTRVRHLSTKPISVDRWQTVIVAIDWFGHQLRAWVDGERVLTAEILGETFDVVGTSFEESDKVISFRNYGYGTRYHGLADNLRVFKYPLQDSDLPPIFSPKIEIQPFQSGILVAWPVDATGYELESTTALGANWLPAASPATTIGELKLIVENPPESSRGMFYRLRRN
ncbi:MAG TPA: LamG-like jellyroll fold domain-containing protein, partial [Verrucomicrobiae bacterium]|nr:LamG-like jellyroll fold domain-containing protein [Verrucomicrobiae bacterium]